MAEEIIKLPSLQNPEHTLHCCHIAGDGPLIFYLTGFSSNIEGSKIKHLRQWALENNHALTCFDYRGHGQSTGTVRDYLFSDWYEDSCQVFEHFATDEQIIIGSSMGGWMAMKLLGETRYHDRFKAAILLAPAPDFHEYLLGENELKRLGRDKIISGNFEQLTVTDDDPYVFTLAMIEDAPNLKILNNRMDQPCPITILHGDEDDIVPRIHALKAFDYFASDDKEFHLIGGGDHSLARKQDLQYLTDMIDSIG